ncbi:winged helix-turn-helix transcriptional regulator [Micromonospora chokoriensis]
MLCLEGGPRRFTEIRVPLRAVTPKVLTQTLRAMERDGRRGRRHHRAASTCGDDVRPIIRGSSAIIWRRDPGRLDNGRLGRSE